MDNKQKEQDQLNPDSENDAIPINPETKQPYFTIKQTWGNKWEPGLTTRKENQK